MRKSKLILALTACALNSVALADNEFRVGTGAGCTHSTIQAALEAAANDGNTISRVIITRSLSYTNQALRINDRESLTLEGGFNRCSDSSPSAPYTTINGAGGAKQSIISVLGDYPSTVRLSRLELIGGDAEDHEFGGAVYARHGGVLSIVASSIHGNRAGFGGGIAVENQTTLLLGEASLVYENGAASEGGGAYCRGQGDVYVIGPNVGLFNNNALHAGGGLRLYGCNAELASNGPLNAGVVFGNSAYNGGGVSLHGGTLKAYTRDANNPTRIGYNHASSDGGAFNLYSGSEVKLWDVIVEGNSAGRGAAAYIYNAADNSAGIRMQSARKRDDNTPIAAVACASSTICNRVTGNRTLDSNTGEGAAFYFDYYTPWNCQLGTCFIPNGRGPAASIQNAQFDRNSGRSLIYYRAYHDHYAIAQSVFFLNSASDALIKTGGDDKLWVTQSTFSHNTISGPVLRSAALDLRCSIINQAGTVHQGGAPIGEFILLPDSNQLPASTTIFQGVPRFVDSANDNYRLYPGNRLERGSLGVDLSNGACGVYQLDADLDGRARPLDLSTTPNQFGATDLGPFEAALSVGNLPR